MTPPIQNRPAASESFARLKLELGRMVRSLLHAADERRDVAVLQELRAALLGLVDPRPNLTEIAEHAATIARRWRASLEEPAEIELLIDRLQEFVNGAASLASSPGDSEPRREPVRACAVCLRVERELWRFLARRQYELAANGADQREHAVHSGFCPVHTWQYETVASPQGICAAYPELLIEFAARLRTLAEGAPSSEAIESGLRSLLPSEALCPACQLIDSTERGAAAEIARLSTDWSESAARRGEESEIPVSAPSRAWRCALENESLPPLCAFHLRLVLAAGPERRAAARLALQYAVELEKLADDMQNHVLKHDALSRHRLTEAERQAAVGGLARLVGRRDTVKPRRVD